MNYLQSESHVNTVGTDVSTHHSVSKHINVHLVITLIVKHFDANILKSIMFYTKKSLF